MPDVGGGCYCGNIRLTACLAGEVAAYNPRACDCDFCQKHGSAYVSDPRGALSIRIREAGQVNRFRQGSNTAEMLLCRRCGVLVGALYQEADRLFGTLNVKALDCRASFGPEQCVSPKSLSADQKVQRWHDIWFRDVRVTAAVPVLETDRLLLRPLRMEDGPAAQRHFPHWEIVRWLHAVVPWPYPSDGAESFLRTALEQEARGERILWAICLRESPDELIGVIELRPDESSRDQRGFWLALEFQGRGLMTEAANRVTDYAFEELGWPHLWLTNAQDNIASHRIKVRQRAQLIETVENNYVSGVGKGEIWLLKKEHWLRGARS